MGQTFTSFLFVPESIERAGYLKDQIRAAAEARTENPDVCRVSWDTLTRLMFELGDSPCYVVFDGTEGLAINVSYGRLHILPASTTNPERTLITMMNFSTALQCLKAGAHISRAGWNGKGMWLAYQPGYPNGIPINANTAKATGLAEGTVCRFLPYIMMRTADGAFVPWLASQTDILAEDWTATPVE